MIGAVPLKSPVLRPPQAANSMHTMHNTSHPLDGTRRVPADASDLRPSNDPAAVFLMMVVPLTLICGQLGQHMDPVCLNRFTATRTSL
jgi:hypothetical protein